MARLTQDQRAAAILARGMVTDDDIETLSQLNALRDLQFAPGTTFPPHAFGRLARLRWLQFLTFEASVFSWQDMQDLASITTLRSLIFLNCQFGDGELQHLTAPSRLERLWLDGSQITDASLPHIAAMPTVTWLSLSGTDITDAGLVHLTAMTQLQTLYLNDTRITDAGLLPLATLPHLRMGRPTAAMTPAGMATFRAAQRAARTRLRYGNALPPVDADAATAATNHLSAFVQAMYDWGMRAITLSQQIPPPPRSPTAVAEAWQQMCEELRPIITAFCTPKQRPRGKPEYFSVRTPPEYDLATFVIHQVTQVDSRTMEILTEEVHGFEYMYVLKYRKGQWWIDSRKSWSKGRWQPGYL